MSGYQQLSASAADRLRQFADSRRFLLGRPRNLAFAAGPARLLFLRSLAALARAAGEIGETPEEDRCWTFLRDSSSEAYAALVPSA